MVIQDEYGKWDEEKFAPPVLANDSTPETVQADLEAIITNTPDPRAAAKLICQYFHIG